MAETGGLLIITSVVDYLVVQITLREGGVMEQKELRFVGCNFFRQRLAYSLLSGRPVTISEIRSCDDEPGIRGIFDHITHLNEIAKLSYGLVILLTV